MVDIWLQISGEKHLLFFSFFPPDSSLNATTHSCTPDYFGNIKRVSLVLIQEVADMAQWEVEQINHIKEKVTEKGKLEDLQKGKPPAQVLIN